MRKFLNIFVIFIVTIFISITFASEAYADPGIYDGVTEDGKKLINPQPIEYRGQSKNMHREPKSTSVYFLAHDVTPVTPPDYNAGMQEKVPITGHFKAYIPTLKGWKILSQCVRWHKQRWCRFAGY